MWTPFWHDCSTSGHRFEARHDEWPMSPAMLSSIKTVNISVDALNALRRKIYVQDICARCGKVVKRDAAMAEAVRRSA